MEHLINSLVLLAFGLVFMVINIHSVSAVAKVVTYWLMWACVVASVLVFVNAWLAR